MNYTIITQNGKQGVADAAGNIVIPPIYKKVHNVTNRRGSYDANGKYQSHYTGEPRFEVKKGKFSALSNEKHELLTDFKYTDISGAYTDIMQVKIDKKCGIIDMNGNEITTIDYDEFWNMGQPVFFASRNKLHGYLDHSGKVVIPLIHERMGILIMEGLVPVVQNGLTGFMDATGKLVIPHLYHGMAHFDKNGFSCICKKAGSQKHFGIINKNKDIILPFFKYEHFDLVRKAWEANKKIVFNDFKPFLENQEYTEAQAFLATIHHFQIEKYTTYFDLATAEIAQIRSLIDEKHRIGKKLLPLLVEIEKIL